MIYLHINLIDSQLIKIKIIIIFLYHFVIKSEWRGTGTVTSEINAMMDCDELKWVTRNIEFALVISFKGKESSIGNDCAICDL